MLHSAWFKSFQGFLLYLAIFLTVIIGILPRQYSLEVGQVYNQETIYASRSVTDNAATSLAKSEAANTVEPVFVMDRSVADRVVERVAALSEYLLSLQEGGDDSADPNPTQEETVAHMISTFPEVEDEKTALALLAVPAETVQMTNDLVKGLISASLRNGIKEEAAEAHKQDIKNALYQSQTNPDLVEAIIFSLETNFTHNMLYSEEETQKARRAARDKVEDIKILKGAKIIDTGDTITNVHISQLDALGMLHTSVTYGYYLGLAILVLCIFSAWGYFLYKFRPNIFSNLSRVWLVALIILITLWTAKLFGGLLFEAGSPYLIPASLATLLLTIIFDVNMSLFFGMSLSVLIAVMAGSEMNVLFLCIVGSIAGAYSVTKVNQRSDLTRAGLLVAGANGLAILGIILSGDGLDFNLYSFQRTLVEVTMGVGSGILASVFAIGLLPFFEIAFGITTSVRLLELANPNQKPLKRLLLEAPGTYNHSILVGNLAEAAAEVVGADPVLARVGSYYHDLGKLTRPYFFIENQFQGSNPHDKISPSLSSMILTAHVRGGVELADQYKLPPVIKDIIEQHHGDTLIGFFYHRAMMERGSKDQLLEDKFRYSGPKPQFKEAGIIMLADSVEAAVRSLDQPNQLRIQNMVDKIVQEKLDDGQLNQCDLTLKDLSLIAESFVKVLSGIYHKRIAYPTEQDLKIGS